MFMSNVRGDDSPSHAYSGPFPPHIRGIDLDRSCLVFVKMSTFVMIYPLPMAANYT